MNYNQKLYEQLVRFFKDLGFSKPEFLIQYGLMRFYKEVETLKYLIGLSFDLDSIGLNGIHYIIASNAVNQILGKFIDLERNNEFCTVTDFTNKVVWYSEINKLNVKFKESEYNLDDLKLNVRDFLNRFAFPFFAKFHDIKTINDKILNVVPEKDYPEWIHGKSTLKILIIMKLCGNPKYEAYKASKEKDYLFFVNQNPSMWKPAYDTFLALVDYLDKGCYKDDLKVTAF